MIPALGPSFGIAPAGTCTWNELSASASSSMPSSAACARTHEGPGGSDPRLEGVLLGRSAMPLDELIDVGIGSCHL